MYRLLRSKGYEFPAVKREDAAVLNPSDNLKSIAELQKEERLAQSAKLQELVRRGRPQDLKEANELMKIMSGFKEDESLEESKAQVEEDLTKLKRKAEILDEMLNNLTNSGMPIDKSDETLGELISSLRVSQPQIQKLIQEESVNQEEVTRLLELNDTINTILHKVDLLSEGDVSGASKVKTSAGSNALNLIDFDDDATATTTQTSTANTTTTNAQPTSKDAITDLLSDLGGLSFGNSTSTTNQGSINLFSTPPPTTQPAPTQTLPFDLFGNNNNSTTASTAPQPQPVSRPVAPAAAGAAPATSNDPFGFDFLSSTSKSSSPAPPTPSNVPTAFPTTTTTTTATATTTTTKTTTSNTSANPTVLLTSSNLEIKYTKQSTTPLTFQFQIQIQQSNPLSSITNLRFSLAVTKAYVLKLMAPSGTQLSGGVSGGCITQLAEIRSKNASGNGNGNGNGIVAAGSKVKVKFMVEYQVDGNSQVEQGVASLVA
ncbi:unnamed protein product [Ambrosiozyma monospora]|uniref:Unnamed protein product n=1 Tax=Ambrosiozyma monospora TaxID=43982 RepID=A0A9W7DFD9_AMBMO|nr:unnamed protein product [Ambrosiozyma monospora]